jgi:hypothetical protein
MATVSVKDPEVCEETETDCPVVEPTIEAFPVIDQLKEGFRASVTAW